MYIWKTGLFEEVIVTDPAQGLGRGMDIMIKNYITAPYMLYIQEDFEINRTGIDIDRLIWAMENHESINYVIFNKRKNTGVGADFSPKEYNFDGLKLTSWNACNFIPSVWRMSKCKEIWTGYRKSHPEGYWINLWGNHETRCDAEWLENNMGCYLYGGFGEHAYVEHMGNTWRMAKWRMVDGKPGGNLGYDLIRHKWNVPWLKPERRPINKEAEFNMDGRISDTYNQIWENLPDELKEEFRGCKNLPEGLRD